MLQTLRLEGIEKVYPNGQKAVAGVDLEISTGEMVVLLGPSGCGKSTLLRIVAGIETPTGGRVLLGGEDVTELPPQKRDIAMVFQNYSLYPHMTVRENLAFGLRMRKVPGPEIATRVAAVAASLELDELLERRPAQLSGGQRQRVALGRAIVRQAKVFLLDEPLSNLDVQLRVTTRGELARLHRRLDVPMLYVTHDQEEAMTLGDRVVVMKSGQFQQVGSPLDLYERPATIFVAGFIGSPRINFLPGNVQVRDGHTVLEILGTRIEAPRSAAKGETGAPPPGAAIVAGVRPEDLEIVAAAAADIQAHVDVVEPLGRETIVHAIAGGTAGAPKVELRIVTSGAAHFQVGQTIGLRLRRERLHVFDAATERRIQL